MEITAFTDEDGETLSNGTLSKGDGKLINYRADGSKFSEGNYQNGYPEGTWTFYDERERVLTKGVLQKGIKQGPWDIFSKSGRVIETERYLNGELIIKDQNR